MGNLGLSMVIRKEFVICYIGAPSSVPVLVSISI